MSRRKTSRDEQLNSAGKADMVISPDRGPQYRHHTLIIATSAALVVSSLTKLSLAQCSSDERHSCFVGRHSHAGLASSSTSNAQGLVQRCEGSTRHPNYGLGSSGLAHIRCGPAT